MSKGSWILFARLIAHMATASDATPDAIAKTRLSVMSWRSEHRPARTKAQADRHLLCAIAGAGESRFATLTHAINKRMRDHGHNDRRESDFRAAKHRVHAGFRLRHHCNTVLLVVVGIHAAQLSHERVEARPRRRHRDTRLETGDHVQRVVVAALESLDVAGARVVPTASAASRARVARSG